MQKNWSIWISYRWEITPFYLNADNERSQVYKLSFSKGFWETNKSNWIANKTNLIERKTNKINWTSEGKTNKDDWKQSQKKYFRRRSKINCLFLFKRLMKRLHTN